jgi:hypothetical protein
MTKKSRQGNRKTGGIHAGHFPVDNSIKRTIPPTNGKAKGKEGGKREAFSIGCL